ncbi:hypothetical protein PHJA_001573100 [Phtheirospermum japonicum]|uniref:Uncharacterized protein n=1 Tax=Phtheirospermum japonicum TaxID=374723 RepID=A0A830C5A1_9LAMI|nr:hypothetical protein PHJA_001573100 [Phtheirospermum japonicum]
MEGLLDSKYIQIQKVCNVSFSYGKLIPNTSRRLLAKLILLVYLIGFCNLCEVIGGYGASMGRRTCGFAEPEATEEDRLRRRQRRRRWVMPAEREIRFDGEEQQQHQHLFMQEDEMASWIQYPLDDMYADLLDPPPPSSAPISTITQPRVVEENRFPAPPPLPLVPPPPARPDYAPRFQKSI